MPGQISEVFGLVKNNEEQPIFKLCTSMNIIIITVRIIEIWINEVRISEGLLCSVAPLDKGLAILSSVERLSFSEVNQIQVVGKLTS